MGYIRVFYFKLGLQAIAYNVFFVMNHELSLDIVKFYSKYADLHTERNSKTLYGNTFSLPTKYEPIQFIGSGAYGAVIVAKDNQKHKQDNDHLVAIKKMSNVFQHKFYARRILRELKMLRLLKHPNIIPLHEIVLPQCRNQFNNIYGVFQLMDSDLHQIINGQDQLSSSHRTFFLYQALRGLNYMHGKKIVHRDLKPRNILINQNCDLKIADFGFARALGDIINPNLTQYVATRWYRAPQLLLENSIYSTAVDIWSIGCIHAEMILKKVLLKGMSTKDQFLKISEEIGMPDEEKLQNYPKEVQILVRSVMKKRKNQTIFEKLKGRISDEELDLLHKMLQFFPGDRISAADALKHPFFQEIHEQQKIEQSSIPEIQFQFEKHNLNTEQFKDLLYEQTLLYHYKDFAEAHDRKIKSNESLIMHILTNSNSKKFNFATDAEDDEWMKSHEEEVKIQSDE